MNIITGESRILPATLSLYDLVSVLSTRVVDIINGSAIYVEDYPSSTPEEIAIREIIEKRCPLSLIRKVNDNIYEQWEVNELSADLTSSLVR